GRDRSVFRRLRTVASRLGPGHQVADQRLGRIKSAPDGRNTGRRRPQTGLSKLDVQQRWPLAVTRATPLALSCCNASLQGRPGPLPPQRWPSAVVTPAPKASPGRIYNGVGL